MSGGEQQLAPDGYRQTEIGFLPVDWDVARLLDVATLIHGKAHEPFVDALGQFVVVNSKFVSTTGKVRKRCTQNTCPARKGDVLMVLSDLPNGKALAKCYLVEQEDIFAVNQRVCIFRATKVNPVFLFYMINRHRYFLSLDDGVTQTHILNNDIAACSISLPSEIEEQTAIANALSDVDALISSLEKLIAKKRAMKTAAMQQLLTGKKRLPPFDQSHTGYKQTELGEIPEDWEVVALGELCSLKSGEAITAAKLSDGSPYPCYGGNGVRGYTSSYTHNGDHALIGRQGALCGNVQYVRGQFFASEHALVATANKRADAHWLAIYLERMNLNQYSESSAQPGLSAVKLKELTLKTPSKGEQQTIAKVLSGMDSEMEALTYRLTKTQQLKQGMMQELLTGRTRLI